MRSAECGGGGMAKRSAAMFVEPEDMPAESRGERERKLSRISGQRAETTRNRECGGVKGAGRLWIVPRLVDKSSTCPQPLG